MTELSIELELFWLTFLFHLQIDTHVVVISQKRVTMSLFRLMHFRTTGFRVTLFPTTTLHCKLMKVGIVQQFFWYDRFPPPLYKKRAEFCSVALYIWPEFCCSLCVCGNLLWWKSFAAWKYLVEIYRAEKSQVGIWHSAIPRYACPCCKYRCSLKASFIILG